MRAVPDNLTVEVPEYRPMSGDFGWPASLHLPPPVRQALLGIADEVWLSDQNVGPFSWIINGCCPADPFEGPLDAITALAERSNVPVFNHPDAIRRIRRDRLVDTLAGIDGLAVSRSYRFAGDVDEAISTLENEIKTECEVILETVVAPRVRLKLAAGSGKHLDQIRDLPFGGQVFNATVRDPEDTVGQPKFRFAVSAGGAIACRYWPAQAKPEIAGPKEELLRLRRYASSESVMRLCRRIRKRVGLDYFAVDLVPMSRGFLLSDIGAALPTMVRYDSGASNRELDAHLARIASHFGDAVQGFLNSV